MNNPRVIFSTIDNGARSKTPYVHATVEDVRVRFVDRRPEHVGWRCDEHGDVLDCSHSDAIEEHLGRRILDRIEYLIERNYNHQRA